MNHFDHSTLRPFLCVAEARRSLELGMNSVSNCRVPSPKIAENIRSKETGPVIQGLDTVSPRTTVSQMMWGLKRNPIFAYIHYSS